MLIGKRTLGVCAMLLILLACPARAQQSPVPTDIRVSHTRNLSVDDFTKVMRQTLRSRSLDILSYGDTVVDRVFQRVVINDGHDAYTRFAFAFAGKVGERVDLKLTSQFQGSFWVVHERQGGAVGIATMAEGDGSTAAQFVLPYEGRYIVFGIVGWKGTHPFPYALTIDERGHQRAAAAAQAPLKDKTAPASAGARLALLIGNGAYGGENRLQNPPRDVARIAASLRSIGFEVEVLIDADQRSFKRAVARFGERLRNSGVATTGLFYYSGHGLQLGGENYLLPVDASISSEADIDVDGVAVQALLRQMEQAGNRTNIVILDACRSVPLFRQARASVRGLAQMQAPNGSFIAYSTAPGQVAQDGEGRLSPFAAAFAEQLEQSGVPIEELFRNVRRRVQAATHGSQTPWDSSSLTEGFEFRPAAAGAVR